MGASMQIAADMLRPGSGEFERLAQRHNRVPVVATLVGDDLTPVSAFARLATDEEYAFLFESVVGGEKVARYSFVGAGPARTFETKRDQVRLVDHRAGATQTATSGDPLALLGQLVAEYDAPAISDLPRFLGGAVGYASYDTIRYYERLPDAPPDDRDLPDLLFSIYDSLVVFDHVHKVVRVVVHAAIDAGVDAAARRHAHDAAAERIDAIVARLSRPSPLAPVAITLPAPPLTRYASSITPPAFEQMVERCQEYIRAGDIFQVVPSQRLRVETAAAPLSIYRALRVINPSPFMFLLKTPPVTLVGASPEIMCRVEDGVVTNRPLAGTRHRAVRRRRRMRNAWPPSCSRIRRSGPSTSCWWTWAATTSAAWRVRAQSRSRRDGDRVLQPRDAHLEHRDGALADGCTAFDALRAALPVGTVTGAPKVRAMEIIDECEPTRRGPYAGAVGYLDFAGNMDTCIALRTLVMQPQTAGGYHADVQVGAGVVADSVPAREYDETINKAQSLLRAIGVAETCFSG
jgi:anthranilate synthase component 1